MRRLAFLGLLFLGASGVRAEAVPEHELKATYTYNFAALTQWPTQDDADFNICVLGNDELASEMRRLDGKTVHGRAVSVARLGSLAAIRDCQVLYVAEDEAASLPRIASLLGDAPVLTVTDAPVAPDVAVRIVTEGTRLAFEVDVERCRRAGLKPAAALLSLARNLRQAPD